MDEELTKAIKDKQKELRRLAGVRERHHKDLQNVKNL